ncbi:MAG: hypothetical protein ABI335_11785, partial [Polyangiaceae bacterium]
MDSRKLTHTAYLIRWAMLAATAGSAVACTKSCHSAVAAGPTACVVDVITGGDATCLKLGDGSYRCRGENDGTALTHGKWSGLSAPRPWIAMPNQVSSLVLSNGRSCGLDAQGVLWCWGRTDLSLETQNYTEPAPVPLRKFGSNIQSFDAN